MTSGAPIIRRCECREVLHVVYYDDLDAAAYRAGIVVLHAASFGPLWELCRARGLSVVADIHVHPREAWQSEADRQNPMIARSGHLALLVPWFARPPVGLETLGIFQYRGDHKWRDLGGSDIARHFVLEP
jgi:hypothetical protein